MRLVWRRFQPDERKIQQIGWFDVQDCVTGTLAHAPVGVHLVVPSTQLVVPDKHLPVACYGPAVLQQGVADDHPERLTR